MIQFHSIRSRKEYHHICNDELSYNLHKITETFVLLEFLICSAVLNKHYGFMGILVLVTIS